MNFEKKLELSQEEVMRLAKEKAVKTLSEERISSDDFEDFYDSASIKKDKETVARLKRKINQSITPPERETKLEAQILEAIIGEQGELSEWLGSSVGISNTSEFDDLVNGVDLVAEYEKDGSIASHIGLGVDVIMSSNPDGVGEKINKIRGEIEKGKGGTIKYFYSEDLGFKGQLLKIPRIIIGADKSTMQELAKLWIGGGKSKEILGKHWIQFQILESIMLQLESFMEYAKDKGQLEIAERYRRASVIISEVFEERMGAIKDSGERDEFFFTLHNYLDKVLFEE